MHLLQTLLYLIYPSSTTNSTYLTKLNTDSRIHRHLLFLDRHNRKLSHMQERAVFLGRRILTATINHHHQPFITLHGPPDQNLL